MLRKWTAGLLAVSVLCPAALAAEPARVEQGVVSAWTAVRSMARQGWQEMCQFVIGQIREQPAAPDGQPVAVASLQELGEQLQTAIAAVRQPPVFDVSALSAQAALELDVKNLYYGVISAHPDYKYAYDLQAERNGELLRCTIRYMPYRSGDYPEGFAGAPVGSLPELMQLARENIARQSVDIRITNTAMTVDDMNKALQQVGGGYILCQLGRDGTTITFTPQNQLTHAAAAARLDEIDRLAETMLARTVTADGSAAQKAEALYTELTKTVVYDHRYYADRAAMPYDSTTAYGALHDRMAICGGYAQALQVLFDKAGIPCYTVSGKANGEYHMWNIAYLDDVWQYFDPTYDRGRAAYGFYRFAVPAEQLTGYQWDQSWVERLTQAAVLAYTTQ